MSAKSRRSQSDRKPRPTLRSSLNVERLEDRTVPTTLVALTGPRELITFDSSAPEIILTRVAISGLNSNEGLLGIDTRPATGQIYGVSRAGRVFTVDPYTGAATLKATLTADAADTTDPFTAVRGRFFGIDFNPAVDRLRIVSDFDQNLRINVDTGATTTDANLAYATGDANVGDNPFNAAAAYTNPDNDPATATQLFGIDAVADSLVLQNPPNDGTLNSTGALGVNATARTGFDIGLDGTAYAVINRPSSSPALFTINLTTGAATLQGAFSPTLAVRDITAVLPAQPVFAVTSGNNLISFNSARPDVLTSKRAITGLGASETLLGIDFRPATGQLVGLGSTGRLYNINTATARASAGPLLTADPADASNAFTALSGTSFGVDFNPVVDRLRVVSDTDQNLRINVENGFVTTDADLAFALGDINTLANPNVTGSGYSNNFPGATTTVLREIDTGVDALVTQDPPNDGTLNTVGALGVDASSVAGFDVSRSGSAFAALNLEGETVTRFYSIDLTTGTATAVGPAANGGLIAGGESIRAIAIAPPVVQFARLQQRVVEHNFANVPIALILTGDTSASVTVNIAGPDGSATPGEDFGVSTAPVTLGPGNTSGSLEVTVEEDNAVEGDENATLNLVQPAGGGGATLRGRIFTELLILDDDGQPRN